MSNKFIHRREFLKIASTIAAAAASLASAPTIGALLTEQAKLTSEEHDVFSKLVQVCLPVNGTSLIDPSTLPVIQTLEGALLAGMPSHIRQGLRGGISFFNEGPVAEFGDKFSTLPDSSAAKFIEKWLDADEVPARALATGLKKLTLLSYWAIPDTWTPLAYDGPVSDKRSIPSLGNTPELKV